MHHDESIYSRPNEFYYDRFLDTEPRDDCDEKEARSPNKAAATTDVDYAVWGHGKHACPGRVFAVIVVKMIIAYMVENYELRHWDERPANIWIGDTPVPPRNLMVGVRRR